MTNKIKQGTPEWHEQRKMRITGSRVGAVLGVNPWSTQDDVLREMVRQANGAETEFKGNVATRHGNDNEKRAILCFISTTGISVDECGFFAHGDILGASPDGLTSDGGILEIKCPYSLKDGDKPFKKLADQPSYAEQVQMELLATGRKHAYFAQYIAPKGNPNMDFDHVPERIEIERVEFDEEWEARNMPALKTFHDKVKSELSNPIHTEPLRAVIETKLADILLRMFDAAKTAENENKKNRNDILELIVEMANGKNALVHGRKLTKSGGGPSVSYASVVKDLLPEKDLSKWTKTSAVSWLLSNKKAEK